jgi:hypothetical protein
MKEKKAEAATSISDRQKNKTNANKKETKERFEWLLTRFRSRPRLRPFLGSIELRSRQGDILDI